jgi:AcrR family transcriptional regulator
MNKRQHSKIATRAKVVEAARTLWAEPGTYEFWGIRDIAGSVGLSTGAVFANFASKADLWREAMGYEPPVDCAEVRDLLKGLAASRKALSLNEAA